MSAASNDLASALVDAAIERWPSLARRRAALVELTEAALPELEEAQAVQADLVLAQAMAAGDELALAIFEAEFVPQLEGALRRAGIDANVVDDALQVVRFRLLIPTDNRPARIASYRGRSSLRRWFCVVAVREARALAARARARPTTDLELAEGVSVRVRDLEAEFYAREHRQAFSRALATAFAELSPKQRLLLRLDVLDGLSDGEIAKIYQVHRTTALRWIQRAMWQLIAVTKTQLAVELAVEGRELDSLLRGLVSHLDLSLGRLLAEVAPDGADADASEARE